MSFSDVVRFFEKVGNFLLGSPKGPADIVSTMTSAVAGIAAALTFFYVVLRVSHWRERKKVGALHYRDAFKRLELPADRSFNGFIRWVLRLSGSDPKFVFISGYRDMASRFLVTGFLLLSVVLAALAAGLFITTSAAPERTAPESAIQAQFQAEALAAVTASQEERDGLLPKVLSMLSDVGEKAAEKNVQVVIAAIMVYAGFIYLFDLSVIVSRDRSVWMIFLRVSFSVLASLSISSPIATSVFRDRILTKIDEGPEGTRDLVRQRDEIDSKLKAMPAPAEDESSRKDYETLAAVNARLSELVVGDTTNGAIVTCLVRAAEYEENKPVSVSNCKLEIDRLLRSTGRDTEADGVRSEYDALKLSGPSKANFIAGRTTGRVNDRIVTRNLASNFLKDMLARYKGEKQRSEVMLAEHKEARDSIRSGRQVASDTHGNALGSLKQQRADLQKEIDRRRRNNEKDVLLHHKTLFSDVLFSFSWDAIAAWPLFVVLLFMDLSVVMSKLFWVRSPKYDELVDQHEARMHERNAKIAEMFLPAAIPETEYQPVKADDDPEAEQMSKLFSAWSLRNIKNVFSKDKGGGKVDGAES